MTVFFAASDSFLLLKNPTSRLIRFGNPSTSSIRSYRASPNLLLSQFRLRHPSYCYNADSTFSSSDGGGGDLEDDTCFDASTFSSSDGGGGCDLEDDTCFDDDELDNIVIEIEKLTRNSRRIHSKIAIDATLDTIWNILTDYERLADFIPGLAVSQLLQKKPNFARLYQVGEQDLAFGVKFNAKGIVDCYEKDLQTLSSGKRRRDIEFNMIEGDFKIFQGKWSIEQCNEGSGKTSDASLRHDSHSILSYTVNVEPKLWLPVGLVEGRLCREIKTNLLCIRKEAQKSNSCTLSAYS